MLQVRHFLYRGRSVILSAGVFIFVFILHYVWLGFFPEQDIAQNQWVILPTGTSWFRTYIESQNYLFGYTYGVSLGFAAYAFQKYSQSKCGFARNMAFGGVTFSGVLAVSVCFLIGCCGSPMFVVWMNLFGAAFLPFSKILIAVLTTVSVLVGWLWMTRRISKSKEECLEQKL